MAFSPKHILAIDDNEAVRDVIVTMLQEHGYRVTAAGDGLSMREILQRDDPVDAIVLDAPNAGRTERDTCPSCARPQHTCRYDLGQSR
jgi:two-component system OmpR family response regulator